MTMADSALWLFCLLGIRIGWWMRGRVERKAHENDLPQWTAVLGKSIADQCLSVERGHRFAGDNVEVTSEQTYTSGDRRFLVTVTRKPGVIIDA